MFTGLIERVGVVRSRIPRGSANLLEVECGPGPYPLATGDSVAVDGLCLTVTAVAADAFTVDVSSESLLRSTLCNARAGARVNLERALRLGDRLGGHLVSGHIDAVGRILETRPESGFARVSVAAPPEVMALVVVKGSIALDGISLTVNGVLADSFWMTIIPETLARTTLGGKRPGDMVNLETDIVGKYVARLLGPRLAAARDQNLLKKLTDEGFI